MTSRNIAAFFLTLSALAAPAWQANAEIGAIGSPVQPSNPPPAALAQPVQAAPAPIVAAEQPSVRKPVLVIRFNQKNVYFANALEQAVKSVEKVKRGAFYEVLSYSPIATTPSRSARVNEQSAANLQAVILEMQNQGVPKANIASSSKMAPAGSEQKIEIYVK